MSEAFPSVATGVLKQPFAEQLAFFRGKLGKLVPTARWDDLQREAHDDAFMVAGATKAELLEDLAAAVDRAISAGDSLEAFRKDFFATAEKHGWRGWTGDESEARRNWRTKVIYQTNTSTAYSAGREAQLQDAGFPFLVYKHNDSVLYPRPEHQRWDGLTLPAGHPFWQTHSPPNGWGCQCYKVGARTERGARRLGGDPDRELPEGWDDRRLTTGTPEGIDKGWDYRPGATVAGRVAALAEKTIQWDYTTAKAFMGELPPARRDALSRALRDSPSLRDDIRRYAQRILEGRTYLDIPKYRTMGMATTRDIAQVAGVKGGLDVAGYDFTLDPSAVKHIASEHGNAKSEAKRGQVGVEPRHYAKLAEVLNAPDAIEDAGMSWETKAPLLRYRKRIGEEEIHVVVEVRSKRKMLALATLYVRKMQ